MSLKSLSCAAGESTNKNDRTKASFVKNIFSNPPKVFAVTGAFLGACYTGYCSFIQKDVDSNKWIHGFLIGLPLLSIGWQKVVSQKKNHRGGVTTKKATGHWIIDCASAVALASVSDFSPYSSNGGLCVILSLYGAYKGYSIGSDTDLENGGFPNNFEQNNEHNNNLHKDQVDPHRGGEGSNQSGRKHFYRVGKQNSKEEDRKKKSFSDVGEQNLEEDREKNSFSDIGERYSEKNEEQQFPANLKGSGDGNIPASSNVPLENDPLPVSENGYVPEIKEISEEEKNDQIVREAIQCKTCFNREGSNISSNNSVIYVGELGEECMNPACVKFRSLCPKLHEEYKKSQNVIPTGGRKLSAFEHFIVSVYLVEQSILRDSDPKTEDVFTKYFPQITWKVCYNAEQNLQ